MKHGAGRASAWAALLARSPSRPWPDLGVASRVQHRENNHALRFDSVEDAIRKAGYERAAYLAVDLRKHLRIALNGIKRGTDSRKKPLA